jgi:hypothetical protein
MNSIRKAFGIVWLLLAPAAIIFIIYNAIVVISKAEKAIAAANTDTARALASAAKTNSMLQWSIITIIFLPIAFGLIIFGRYALNGEYDK